MPEPVSFIMSYIRGDVYKRQDLDWMNIGGGGIAVSTSIKLEYIGGRNYGSP